MTNEHTGATEEWSPLREIAMVPPTNMDDFGYWEVIWNGQDLEFPSLAELFEWLSDNRGIVQGEEKLLQIFWRWGKVRNG